MVDYCVACDRPVSGYNQLVAQNIFLIFLNLVTCHIFRRQKFHSPSRFPSPFSMFFFASQAGRACSNIAICINPAPTPKLRSSQNAQRNTTNLALKDTAVFMYKAAIHSHKITKIVRALWFAERCVCIRVCKHGDIKLFFSSRANYANTNLKRFWVENSTNLLYLPIPSTAKTWKIFTNMLCQFFFRLSWHFKREKPLLWKASLLQNKNWLKGLVLSFVSRLSLWYWSPRFDRTLQVFIRR